MHARPAMPLFALALAIAPLVAGEPARLPLTRDPRLAPWVIAHRGASDEAPESTMAAFRQAIADGADVLECDVQTTKDGVLVVVHDDQLDRTSDGRGPVSGYTFERLRALDAGSWKHARYKGERIPTFEEVAILARDAGLGLMPEAKTPYALDPGLVERMVGLLDRVGMTPSSVIQSFDHRPLARLHASRPDVKLGPLVDAGIDAIDDVLASAGCWAYLPCFAFMLPDRIEHARQQGYRVCVWTVDRPEHMRRMALSGVDGVMSNKPRLLRRVFDTMKLERRCWLPVEK